MADAVPTLDPEPHDLNGLAALAENRLDPDERARVEAHLVGCAACRKTLATFARATAAQAAPATQPAGPLPRWHRRPIAWLAMAATVVLATGVSLVILRSGPGDVGPAPDGALPTAEVPQPRPAPATEPGPAAAAATEKQGGARPSRPALGALRSGEKRVGDKRFRLEAGVWIDTAFDTTAMLPSKDIETDAARTALLRETPALAPYAALGARVIVVFDGTVYRFDVK